MDPLSYENLYARTNSGEVPVEEDDPPVDVPANRSLFFIALDKNNDTISGCRASFP